MFNYRRETALHGALVLAKSGRLELGDNILRTLQVYIRPLWHRSNRPEKLSNSVIKRKIRAIRALKIIQGHRGRYQSKARTGMRLPISDICHPIAYRFGVIAALFKVWTLCVFWALFGGGGLETQYDVHLGHFGKRVVDFQLVLIELLC